MKIIAVGLNLSTFCCRYENLIHSSVAITKKKIIELNSFARSDNSWNDIFLGDIQKAYFAHSAMPPQHKILKLALPSIIDSLTSPTKYLRRNFVATMTQTDNV